MGRLGNESSEGLIAVSDSISSGANGHRPDNTSRTVANGGSCVNDVFGELPVGERIPLLFCRFGDAPQLREGVERVWPPAHATKLARLRR